ncbi:MAG: hypothetical protein QM766_09795 [Burkholderiaceae bacterium]
MITAAAALLGEREEPVRRSIAAFLPVAIAAFSGHAHRPGQRDRFHADVTGERVDLQWIAPGPSAEAQQRLPSALRAGRQAGITLFGEQREQAARALAASTDIGPSSAAVLIDLSLAFALSQLKRIAFEARLDAQQLGRMLASQYEALATRTDPSLVEGLGHPSVAAWLSARGADSATCHPMAPDALARRQSRLQLSFTARQLLLAVLIVSIGAMILGSISPFREGLRRFEAARGVHRHATPTREGPSRHGFDSRAVRSRLAQGRILSSYERPGRVSTFSLNDG